MHATALQRIPVGMLTGLFAAAALALSASAWAGGHDHAKTASAKMPAKDIVATAVAAGSFNTLAAALEAAGLVEALQGPGPFMVFAPTDAAFAKLPAGTLDSLLKDKEKLTAILTYHVVPGKVTAADVVKVKHASTVNGAKLAVDTSEGVRVGNAKVVKTDIMASNGVIHVIDTVLLP